MDPLRVVVDRYGGPEVMRLEDFAPPSTGPRQAWVRHTAIGLNFIDTYHRSGLYPLPYLPHGLGMEAVGVIERIDGYEDGLGSGQRVVNISGPPGAYATHAALDAERLIPVPNDIPDDIAAAVTLKGITAEYLIFRTYRPAAGDFVLWHGAAGGLGTLACQWLHKNGVRVIGTVGSASKVPLAKANGCEFVLLRDPVELEQQVRAITEGAGVGVVYDGVGADTFEASLDCLRPRGLYVGVGNASGKPRPLDITVLAQKGSLFLTRPTVFDYTSTRAELLESAKRVFDAVRDGTIEVHIGQRFALADIVKAHEQFEARKTQGCTIIEP